MALYEASDVYLEEQDLSGSTTTAGSTSTGALVTAAKRGPLGPRKVTNGTRFAKKYGKRDATVSYGHYAAQAFLEEANELWVNRVVGAGATYGGLVLQKKTSVPVDAVPVLRPFTIGNPSLLDFANLAGSTNDEEQLLALWCEGPGSYSNELYVRLVSDNLKTPTGLTAADIAAVGTLPVGTILVGTIDAGTYAYTISAFNAVGETLHSTVATVTITGTDTSVYLAWTPVEGAYGYKVFGRTTGTEGMIAQLGGGETSFIDRGTVAPNTAITPVLAQVFTQQFVLEVYDYTESVTNPVESFDCSMVPVVNGNGRQVEVAYSVNSGSDRIRLASNAVTYASGSIPPIFTTGKVQLGTGSSGAAVLASDVSAGWEVFRDPEKTDARILINGGYSVPSVQLKMLDIANARRDAVAVLDLPSEANEAQKAVDYRRITLNVSNNRGALYGPDLLIEDTDNGRTEYVPPSGHVAAILARTDRVSFPWRAPAGLNRGQLNILGLRVQYDPAERNMLWRSQVNYVRSLPGLGRAVWEQRTLQGFQSGFSFLNVRRLFDVMAQTIKQSMYGKEFEPNDDVLRHDIKTEIEGYMLTVQRARGIKSSETVVDDRNNPAAVTAIGQLNVDVFAEPTLPAEKIRVRMNLTEQGVDYSELLNNISL